MYVHIFGKLTARIKTATILFTLFRSYIVVFLFLLGHQYLLLLKTECLPFQKPEATNL